MGQRKKDSCQKMVPCWFGVDIFNKTHVKVYIRVNLYLTQDKTGRKQLNKSSKELASKTLNHTENCAKSL